MRRRRRRNQRLTHTASFIGAALSTALVAGCLLWFFGPVVRREAHPIEVPEGASLRQIGHQLEQDRVIHSAAAFELVGRLMGAERRLRAGRFLITAPSAPHQIVNLLVSGPMMPNQVTLPEGLTLWEFAGILSAQAQVDSAQFVAAACDSQLAAQFGIARPTLEGYLYPDTYDVPIGMPAAEVIALLVGRAQSVLTGVIAGRSVPAPLGNAGRVVILASIVEAEAHVPAERPQIAAVYLNRLRLGMRLEADPTVAYALRARRRLYFKDLEIDSPWNTYRVTGLPPTAICNPGRGSIEAVMTAASLPPTADLYFVARGDGTHVFSKTFEEHTQACLRFRGSSGGGGPEGGGGTGAQDSLRSRVSQPGEEPGTSSRTL